jgi:DNA polymerase III beta subunit
MWFIVNTREFKSKLNTLGKLLSGDWPSVASSILLETEPEYLSMTVTNLDTSAKTAIFEENGGIKIEDDSNAIIVPKTLASAIAYFDDDSEIEMSITDNNKLQIKNGKNKLSLSSLDASKFPELKFDYDKYCEFPKELITDYLPTVMSASSLLLLQPILTGIRFYQSDGVLSLQGADGFRMAFTEMKIDSEDFDVTIPRNSLTMLPTITEDSIGFGFHGNKVVFEVGDFIFQLPTLGGIYPNFMSKVTRKYKIVLKLDFEWLRKAINLCSLVGENGILEADGSKLYIRTESQAGSHVSSLDYECEPFKVALKLPYLKDLVSTAKEDIAKIGINSSTDPVAFISGKEVKSVYIILPLLER